jgi:hypothetical protein
MLRVTALCVDLLSFDFINSEILSSVMSTNAMTSVWRFVVIWGEMMKKSSSCTSINSQVRNVNEYNYSAGPNVLNTYQNNMATFPQNLLYILINIITCLLPYSDYCINNFQANVFFLILNKNENLVQLLFELWDLFMHQSEKKMVKWWKKVQVVQVLTVKFVMLMSTIILLDQMY